jgi:hypothetical protein
MQTNIETNVHSPHVLGVFAIRRISEDISRPNIAERIQNITAWIPVAFTMSAQDLECHSVERTFEIDTLTISIGVSKGKDNLTKRLRPSPSCLYPINQSPVEYIRSARDCRTSILRFNFSILVYDFLLSYIFLPFQISSRRVLMNPTASACFAIIASILGFKIWLASFLFLLDMSGPLGNTFISLLVCVFQHNLPQAAPYVSYPELSGYCGFSRKFLYWGGQMAPATYRLILNTTFIWFKVTSFWLSLNIEVLTISCSPAHDFRHKRLALF